MENMSPSLGTGTELAVAPYIHKSFSFFLLGPALSHNNIIANSTAHSIMLVGRGIWSSVLSSKFKQVAQAFPTHILDEHLQGWKPHNLPGCLALCWTMVTVIFFSYT